MSEWVNKWLNGKDEKKKPVMNLCMGNEGKVWNVRHWPLDGCLTSVPPKAVPETGFECR